MAFQILDDLVMIRKGGGGGPAPIDGKKYIQTVTTDKTYYKQGDWIRFTVTVKMLREVSPGVWEETSMDENWTAMFQGPRGLVLGEKRDYPPFIFEYPAADLYPGRNSVYVYGRPDSITDGWYTNSYVSFDVEDPGTPPPIPGTPEEPLPAEPVEPKPLPEPEPIPEPEPLEPIPEPAPITPPPEPEPQPDDEEEIKEPQWEPGSILRSILARLRKE